MLYVERYQPVAHVVEEGVSLHLREAAEIDVGTLLLHVHHALEGRFKLLHALLGSPRVQNVLHGVLGHLLDAVLRDAEGVVLHQVRHDFVAQHRRVLLGIQRVHQLHLQFRQLTAHALRRQQLIDHVALLGIDVDKVVVDAQYPPHQGALAHMLVLRTAIDIDQQPELHHVEAVHQRQHDSRHQQLLVVAVHRWRHQQFFHVAPHPFRPDA